MYVFSDDSAERYNRQTSSGNIPCLWKCCSGPGQSVNTWISASFKSLGSPWKKRCLYSSINSRPHIERLSPEPYEIDCVPIAHVHCWVPHLVELEDSIREPLSLFMNQFHRYSRVYRPNRLVNIQRKAEIQLPVTFLSQYKAATFPLDPS